MEKRKLTKEDLDKVRDIEGFPIGSDEDIIALSDAPYYTAYPNPFIKEFIEENGTPYDEETDDYHCEPYAADVSEGKNDAIYNAHTYHTKVPYKAIMRYILHYTKPKDLVFDGFCGTGMTGVAANMCAHPESQFQAVLNAEDPDIEWGARIPILQDLSPIATCIAHNYNADIDIQKFTSEAERILSESYKECKWMYATEPDPSAAASTLIRQKGKINYTVWSDVFVCPHCGSEVVFYDAAADPTTGKVSDSFACPKCNAQLKKKRMQ
ncbi:DNA methyltransferase [Lacticaseibacillus camelliae]|uniref:DNA methyltransferase n=1 Tax=Lacticaseibacillus camelliae TaxID=381742 RepID=UPI000ACC8071|nr:DNA methyltransferase [Lacticaseibacillus camelliae]